MTLRVFDLQAPLSRLCTLKPAQTPNVDRLLPTIDVTSTETFGVADRFAAQVLASLTVPEAGTYTFRLTSDDGSKLTIDGSVVVDHDGLHGPIPAEGSVELDAGTHDLRIDHFERDGGQQITLEWRTPGSTTFTLVPNSVLSTPAGVVRVTAPGKKECEGGADSAGDGLPLTDVHPSYSLTDLRPAGFEPKVTGFDWLPDGRLALLTWGGTDASGSNGVKAGKVYLVGNVTGAAGPGQVTIQEIAAGLNQPMGIVHVDGELYVSEKDRLVQLDDTDGDGVTNV